MLPILYRLLFFVSPCSSVKETNKGSGFFAPVPRFSPLPPPLPPFPFSTVQTSSLDIRMSSSIAQWAVIMSLSLNLCAETPCLAFIPSSKFRAWPFPFLLHPFPLPPPPQPDWQQQLHWTTACQPVPAHKCQHSVRAPSMCVETPQEVPLSVLPGWQYLLVEGHLGVQPAPFPQPLSVRCSAESSLISCSTRQSISSFNILEWHAQGSGHCTIMATPLVTLLTRCSYMTPCVPPCLAVLQHPVMLIPSRGMCVVHTKTAHHMSAPYHVSRPGSAS